MWHPTLRHFVVDVASYITLMRLPTLIEASSHFG